MRIDAWCWLVALWLALMVSSCAWANGTAPACPQGAASLAASSRLIGVPIGTLTPDDVMRLPASRFQPVVNARLLKYGKTDWWFRVDLHNAGADTCRRWLLVGPARLRDVHVYVPRANGWKVMRSGTAYPMQDWALPERQPVFPLVMEPGSTTRVLVRVAARGEMVSLVPQLWHPDRYQRMTTHRAFGDALMYGGMLLLVLASLALAWVYRRLALCYMALAAGFYISYVATQNNYAFVYLWPDLPQLNLWARYFLTGMTYAAGLGYLCHVVRVRRLGPWWSSVFILMAAGFVSYALLSILLNAEVLASRIVLMLDAITRWLLGLAVIAGFWRGTLRGWYPPLVVGLLCAQSIQLHGHLLGLGGPPSLGIHVFASTTLMVGLFLLCTLISQVHKGRRRELLARAALDRQHATENQRLEQTVALRTRELDRALQVRRQLLGRISHDLRAPLAAMLDSVRLWRTGDTRHDYPDLIERHARRQMDLIDELLEFSRTELTEPEAEPVPGYLYAFLNDVAESVELAVERHGNRLQCAFADNLPALVYADFHYLHRVLGNLLGNAVKFNRQSRIRFAVERVGTATTTGSVRLHFMVDDDGPGMAPAERKRLVQPFARGGRAAHHEGSGLGLAIVTTLLEHMGSRLDIGTSPSGGGRFHFQLDLALATESELEPLMDDGGSIDVDGAGRVVLVVDDDAQQREVTCDLLDGCGFDSVAAVDGHAACGVLRDRTVDLVITDQYMDGIDGWSLLHTVRCRHPGLPVVLYSALPPRRPSGRDTTSDFDAALLKPVDGATLLHRIALLLDKAGTGRTLAGAVDR